MLAERVTESGDPIAPYFAKLVEHYYAHRFGEQPLDRTEVDLLMQKMRGTPKHPRPETRN